MLPDGKIRFCTFRTNYAGECGVAILDGLSTDRCLYHRGKKECSRRSKAPKTRGYSKHYEEQGMFQKKVVFQGF